DDITIQVALVRPGPIQGGAVHPYIERRQKLREDPSYEPPADHPLLAEPLRETLGVIVFQDQVLDVAIHLAGFTVGEAEGLRRVDTLPPDVVRSAAHCVLEGEAVRVGLSYVQGLSDDAAEALVEERERAGAFTSLRDLAQRVALRDDELRALVESGACDGFGP